jgi:predicted nucleic acid-binding protein
MKGAGEPQEVDPGRLPDSALLDTTVMIRALGDRPNDPRAPLCASLFAKMVQIGKRVLVAAPTVAEMMRSSQQTMPPRSRYVEIVPFDLSAAMMLADKLPLSVLKTLKEQGLGPLTYLKYDALIVACAIRHKADCLVTLDKTMGKLAEQAELPCKTPSDFLQRQTTLKF